MAQTIYWVPPSNDNVGSVLIYRATDAKADSVGSRTIIATIAAKSGTDWVVSYSDAGGGEDSIYRVQFWDGIGSSPISDAIGREFSEQLATFDDVLRLARLTGNYDVGSATIYDAIQDATDEVFFNYGDPVKKSVFYLDSENGVEGQAYNFTGDYGPVYQVREVFVETVDTDIVPGTSYQINYGDGTIKFTNDFLGSYQGEYVFIHWVPSIVNVYVKHMAALNLLEGEMIITGAETNSPYVQKLKDKIMKIEDHLRPQGVFAPKHFEQKYYDGYEVIPQKTDRRSIYFTN